MQSRNQNIMQSNDIVCVNVFQLKYGLKYGKLEND